MDYRSLAESFSWDSVRPFFDWDWNEKLNMAHECCDRWANDPHRIAVYWEDQTGKQEVWTFRQLKEHSDRMANAFRSLGVKKGDRVAALLGKDMELIMTALATWKLGAIYVPLFTAFGPEAIRHRLTNAECKILVTNEEQVRKLEGLDIPAQLILTNDANGIGLSFWELLHSAPPDFEIEQTKMDDPCVIQYTSGTTGLPKGAVAAHKGLITAYPYMKFAIGLEPDDIFLGGADPGWAYGLFACIFYPLSFGVTIVVYKGPFDAEKYYQLMEKYKVTNFTYAPTAYRMMMAGGPELAKKYRFYVRKFSSAGEPLNAEVVRFFKEHFGREVYDHYGATEAGMIVNNFNATDMIIKPGSMGLPTPGFHVALLDPEGRPVPDGEVGEIAVDTSGFASGFLGYWKDPDKTAEKMRGKWLLTGDLAYRDEDGYFWFRGRSDDIISSAGYRIGPFEVESCLLEHPAVAEAAVIGKPDEEKGEIVKAYVILHPQYAPSDELADELSQFVKSRLSRHQYPREIEFATELPKTPSGKYPEGKGTEQSRVTRYATVSNLFNF
ncbi:MAG: acetate--CoA ligase [Bacillus thermozeamaize]|uniref:Acetate--CoA ligase n=1 Tax=Bacillus thermozeamaize TaxID=230954 RepID=A0A1Y3PX95_9BACI|nr:MAG: acetate--CoA ligase [Bacillus thermozeamaize]